MSTAMDAKQRWLDSLFDHGARKGHRWANAAARTVRDHESLVEAEAHLQKRWKLTNVELETSAFLHHLIDDEPIAYNTNRIEEKYLGYLQVGVRF